MTKQIRCMNAPLGDSWHGNVPLEQVRSVGPWALYKCPRCAAYQEATQGIDGTETWRNLGPNYKERRG